MKLYSLIKKYWPVIVIITVPIPTLFWLPNNQSLAHGLFYPWPEEYSSMFRIARYYTNAWMPGGLGFINTELSGLLFYLISAMFLLIGGNAHLGQSLLLYVGFTSTLFGFYTLGKTLGFNRVSSVLSGVLFIFSPFIFTGSPIENTNFRLLFFHATTPLLLSFFIKALWSKSFKKLLSLFGIIAFLANAGYGSLQYLVLHVIILFIYGSYATFSVWKNKILLHQTITRLMFLFIAIFFINFYWIGPMASSLEGAYASRAEPGFSEQHDTNMIMGTGANIIDAFRAIPYKDILPSSPWMMYYYNALPTALIFLILAVIPFGLIYKRTRRLALFPMLWLLISIFLTKGGNDPLGSIEISILNSHPYITRLFRNVTYFELILIPSLSLLTGLALGTIFQLIKHGGLRRVAEIIITIAIIITGLPFITGAHIGTPPDAPAQTNIVPPYFQELTKFLQGKKELSRVNAIPSFTRQDAFIALQWMNIYLGTPILGNWSGKFLYRPLYPMLMGKVDPVLNDVLHPQMNLLSNNAWRLLSNTANIRYVIFHKDIAWSYLYNLDPEKFSLFSEDRIQEFLFQNYAIEKVDSFGKIDVFKFSDKYFLPRVYIAKNIINIRNNEEYFSKRVLDRPSSTNSAFFLSSQNNKINNIDDTLHAINTRAPVLEFKQVNPVKYRVRIHDAPPAFTLVLSESFHPGWKIYFGQNYKANNAINKIANWLNAPNDDVGAQADQNELAMYVKNGWVSNLGDENNKIGYISKNFQGSIQNDNLPDGLFYETWIKEPAVDEDNHLIANVFANSWVVNTREICEQQNHKSEKLPCALNSDGTYNLELVLEFWPQRIFRYSMYVSGIMLSGCIIYLLASYARRRH